MSDRTLNARILIKSDTYANWTKTEKPPVLLKGELGILIDGTETYSSQTGRIKVGDGATAWASLPFINVTPADITNGSYGIMLESAYVADGKLKSDKLPLASETVNGTVEIATNAEVQAGSGTPTISGAPLVVTVGGLASRTATTDRTGLIQIATSAEVNAHTETSKAVTPATLLKGQANGVASLDSNGLVPSAQLPSYVDDVVEAYVIPGSTALSANWLTKDSNPTASSTPIVPQQGIIYIVLSDGEYYHKVYRWSGSTYVEIANFSLDYATKAEAEEGTNNKKVMTPLRTKEAIDYQRAFGVVAEISALTEGGTASAGTTDKVARIDHVHAMPSTYTPTDNTVATIKIVDGAVTAAKLAADSVETAKIKDGNVTAAKLDTDSVTTIKIVDANVTAAKLAIDAVETAKIKDANVTAAKLAADSVETAKIKDANVTTAKIADLAITDAKLAADSVTTAKIVDANVTADKLASDSVTTAKIVDLNVTTDKLAASAVTSAKLADDSVTTAKIVDANVTAAKLATDSVETAKIKDVNVTTAKIADGAITVAKLATDAVETAKIKDANVITAKIADSAITNAKIDSVDIAKVYVASGDTLIINGGNA